MPTDEKRKMTVDQVCAQTPTPRMGRWLAYGVGIAAGTLVTTRQLSTFAPVLVVVGVLAGLPIFLIIMLVVVAVYSPHSVRRETAERILSQLLNALTGAQQQ